MLVLHGHTSENQQVLVFCVSNKDFKARNYFLTCVSSLRSVTLRTLLFLTDHPHALLFCKLTEAAVTSLEVLVGLLGV